MQDIASARDAPRTALVWRLDGHHRHRGPASVTLQAVFPQGRGVGSMRSFEDSHGQRWQAALLEASYGNIALVFSPMHGSDVLQILMAVETLTEAQDQLAALDDAGLQALLGDARPWDGGSLM